MTDTIIKRDGYIKNDEFQFFLPVEYFQKSKKENEKDKDDQFDDCCVRGIASTEHRDLQQEILKSNGLDVHHLKEGRGIFNYDHKEGPENVIGKIDTAEVTDKGLMVEGYLFKHHTRGRAFLEIMKSLKPEDKHRVQMSVEGKIMERDSKDAKTITKAAITKVALTLDPVNPHTYTEFVKSLTAAEESAKEEPVKEEIEKAQKDDKKDHFSKMVPLIIRLMEWAKEECKDDAEIHKVIEAAENIHKDKKSLDMSDYNDIMAYLKKEDPIKEVKKSDGEVLETKRNEALVKKVGDTLHELFKMLSIGSGYTVAPSQMAGGAAISKESLATKKKKKKQKS